MTDIQTLPLDQKHRDAGARMGAFGDWEVPLYYTSILKEHEDVRQRAGLFDISHMGEFWFRGQDACQFLNDLLPRDFTALKNGQAIYMPMLREDGSIVDDIIAYRFAEQEFLLIVNAGNVAKDEAWVRSKLKGDVEFTNESQDFGLLALQGPQSAQIIEEAFPKSGAQKLAYYHFVPFQSGMIARTGYTGEDGFEIMVQKSELEGIWKALFEAGKEGLTPVGFGARDTLRLEAGMCLYGHDMDDEINALEAGLGWTLDFNKEDFIGKSALLKIKEKGIEKRLVGFEMLERGIPRQHQAIFIEGQKAGEVTSGSMSPTFKKNIGMGYVPFSQKAPGTKIAIEIRDKQIQAEIIKLPFYKRKS